MRIVFMGTPAFAVPGLIRLAKSEHEVTLVVTPPDRPKGRGLKMIFSPVKQAALDMALSVVQPESLDDPDFIQKLKQTSADVFAVVGFRILPPEVFQLPHGGTVNLHASLLPKYRGAAPIQWALMNGDDKTGVTTFFIKKRVDTGDMILQKEIPILREDNGGSLHDKLADAGAEILLQTMNMIREDSINPVPQTGEPSLAPKILPEHMQIDWQQSAQKIANQIRAFAPRPGASTQLGTKRLKIYHATVHSNNESNKGQPGDIVQVHQDKFLVQCGEGVIAVDELQLEGKKRMYADAFLRGVQLETGTVLGK